VLNQNGMRRTSALSGAATPQGQGKECSYCHKPNHQTAECRKKKYDEQASKGSKALGLDGDFSGEGSEVGVERIVWKLNPRGILLPDISTDCCSKFPEKPCVWKKKKKRGAGTLAASFWRAMAAAAEGAVGLTAGSGDMGEAACL